MGERPPSFASSRSKISNPSIKSQKIFRKLDNSQHKNIKIKAKLDIVQRTGSTNFRIKNSTNE